MWKERAEVIFYALTDSAKTEIEALRKFAAKNTPQDVLKKFNKKREIVSFRQETMEKGRNKVVDALGFKAKTLSEVEINKKDNSLNFLKIEKVLSPSQKTLKEARGFAIADYQDFLEKQWIENLTNSYRVDIDKNVLNSLVK
jgi:peptidyl-prolyl cis-trans isomerase SurA